MDPPPQIPNVRTKYAVRQLLPAPSAVVLPTLLTDIYSEPLPVLASLPAPALLPALASPPPRTPPPHPRPAPARTPARARTPTRARTPPVLAPPLAAPTALRRIRTVFDESRIALGASPEATPEPEQDFTPIKRPANTSISHVKSIFAELYPDCGGEEQDAHSLALSHQDKDCLKTVNDELVKGFRGLRAAPRPGPSRVTGPYETVMRLTRDSHTSTFAKSAWCKSPSKRPLHRAAASIVERRMLSKYLCYLCYPCSARVVRGSCHHECLTGVDRSCKSLGVHESCDEEDQTTKTIHTQRLYVAKNLQQNYNIIRRLEGAAPVAGVDGGDDAGLPEARVDGVDYGGYHDIAQAVKDDDCA
ncbi:hypothetical protein K438DRAFT_1782206, partial [Mycena galopus ATCC 62051]